MGGVATGVGGSWVVFVVFVPGLVMYWGVSVGEAGGGLWGRGTGSWLGGRGWR